MPGTYGREFEILVSPLNEGVLFAWKMKGREELGRPFRYELTMLSDDPVVPFEEVVGQRITLQLDIANADPRYFDGYVTSFVQEELVGKLHVYRATLEPWTWFLAKRKTCRVFQGMSVIDIFKEVCGDAEYVNYRILDPGLDTYTPRDYCVQYRETDFEFISRLFEEEGIYYFFEHTSEEGHRMVLCDGNGEHGPFLDDDYMSTLYYRRGENKVESWTIQETSGPDVFRHRDFDFSVFGQPVGDAAKAGGSTSEVYDYPGRFSSDTFRHGTEPGDASKENEVGKSLAATRTEELLCLRSVVRAKTSVVRGVHTGHIVSMADHPREDQHTGHLVVNALYEIEGDDYQGGASTKKKGQETTQQEDEFSFRCTFSAIPKDTQFRPPRVTPRPQIAGPQTATVMGPTSGGGDKDEIYADKFGRIKVRFHWDLEDFDDEKHSCWVRVAQMWAGNAFGALFMPRVGQEVVVAFLDGDLDRPIVIGSVYNSANPLPWDPAEMPTISGIRTRSVGTVDSSNELRFDDKTDAEQVFLHAQKDLEMRVKNDRKELVEKNRHLIVKQDKFEHVENNRTDKVDADHKEEIGKDRHLKVKGKEAKEVAESLSLTVKGDVIEEFKDSHSEVTSNDYYLKAKNVVIEASDNITLSVGGSHIAIEKAGIEIHSGGTLKIDGAKVEMKGSGQVKVEGGSTEVKGSGLLKAEGAMVEVSGSATTIIKGGIVKIN
ncbi:MAG: type VI secretion system Vgr family protein [Planctomycetota bacterium]|jgi:type VI secretion system secreted protein VgrG